MNSMDPLHNSAAELIKAAQVFHSAAGQPGSHAAAPPSRARTEEALQLLSGAWYQLAADAAPGIAMRRRQAGTRHPRSQDPTVSRVSRRWASSRPSTMSQPRSLAVPEPAERSVSENATAETACRVIRAATKPRLA